MSDVEIVIRLPEALIQRAQADGLPLTDESITSMIEAELVRAQAARRLRDAMQRLEGSVSPEDIEAELARAKAERMAGDKPELG